MLPACRPKLPILTAPHKKLSSFGPKQLYTAVTKNEMGGSRNTYGVQESCVEHFGRET